MIRKREKITPSGEISAKAALVMTKVDAQSRTTRICASSGAKRASNRDTSATG
jgi:hypothetical protein